MTVGITITNGREAIAITDSKTSGAVRESNSTTKLSSFQTENYTGALFGSGLSNTLASMRLQVTTQQAKSLQELAERISKEFVDQFNKKEREYSVAINEHLKQISTIPPDDEWKARTLSTEVPEGISGFKNGKSQTQSNMIMTGYDHDAKKICSFYFDHNRHEEIFLPHSEIGSGSDGADIYLSTKLQGVDTTQLQTQDLLFFALNAYATATINKGVGGTPTIARISNNGCVVLPVDKTIALANLSGIYLSEAVNLLNNTLTRRVIGEILNSEKPDYKTIAKLCSIDSKILRTVCVPYSAWQETAARTLYH